MKRLLISALCACAFGMLPQLASAENWPERPLTLIVPYAAGTSIDRLARALATGLSTRIGQPVVVDNKPGAGANIGTVATVRAKPDGYTLMIGANSSLAANKYLYSTLPYDPQADLTPVAFLGTGAMVVVTSQGSGIRTMQDLLARAKAAPDKVFFGAANPTARVWVELAKPKIGADSPTILYANASPMFNELMGNQITASIDNTGTMRPLISSGKLVALAVTSQKRSKFDPNVPTLNELGLSDAVIDPWFAVFAPKNTPPQIVKKLERRDQRIAVER